MTAAIQFNSIIFSGFIVMMVVSLLRQRTLFTPGVLFASSWVIVALANMFVFNELEHELVPDTSYELQSKVLIAAFLGFLLAQSLFGKPKATLVEIRSSFPHIKKFMSSYFLIFMSVSLALSLLAFFSTGGGLDFSFGDIRDFRKEYVSGESYNVYVKIAVYWYFVHSTLFILMALHDYIVGRPNIARIAIATLAIIPLAMAKGSRLEFVIPILYYMVTYWTLFGYRSFKLDDRKQQAKILRRIAWRGSAIILSIAVVFGAFGDVRNNKEGVFKEARSGVNATIYSVSSYMQSSLVSVGPVTEWLDQNTEPTYGQRYFEVAYQIPMSLGFIDSRDNKSVLRDQYSELGYLVYTPGSMTRHVASDFGFDNTPYVIFMITFLSAAALIKMRPSSFHLVIFLCLVNYDLFYSFHKVGLFSMDNVYRLIFGYALFMFYNYFVARAGRQPRRLNVMQMAGTHGAR